MKTFFPKMVILFRLICQYTTAKLRWLANGCPSLSEAQELDRLAACNECEHRIPYVDGGELPRKAGTTEFDLCGLCHCFLHEKAVMATERCPDIPDRWLKITDSMPANGR
jgi:hypothetical protein